MTTLTWRSASRRTLDLSDSSGARLKGEKEDEDEKAVRELAERVASWDASGHEEKEVVGRLENFRW